MCRCALSFHSKSAYIYNLNVRRKNDGHTLSDIGWNELMTS